MNGNNLTTNRGRKQAQQKRKTAANAINGARFAMLRYDLVFSEAYKRLSPYSQALLAYLIAQYNGKNNGDLTVLKEHATDINMAISTMYSAKDELLNAGFLELTRQGGKNRCSLYALTCFKIDDIRNKDGTAKIDAKPTKRAADTWKKHKQDSNELTP